MYPQLLDVTQTERSALKRVFNFNGNKLTRRRESWGSITYDFDKDLFSAEIDEKHAGEITPAAPLGLYWLVTAPCNLKCIHCYGNVEELPRDLSSEVAQETVADRIIESGAMRVTLNGGEPLLRADTPAIIERLADHDVAVILGTNGTFLTPSILSSVRRTNRVEISFDSNDESTNNFIRVSRAKTGNAYRESLAAIDLCLNEGIRLRVLTCINRYNYESIEQIADLLHAQGVRDWSVSWTLHAGRARHIYATLMPSDPNSVEARIERVRLKYPDMKIKSSNRSDPSANNRFSCLVFPDGRVFAEDLEAGRKIPFHSLLKAPLVDAWTDENFNRIQHFKRWVGDRRSDYGSR